MKREIIESDLAEITKYAIHNNRDLTISEHDRFDAFFQKAITVIKNNEVNTQDSKQLTIVQAEDFRESADSIKVSIGYP